MTCGCPKCTGVVRSVVQCYSCGGRGVVSDAKTCNVCSGRGALAAWYKGDTWCGHERVMGSWPIGDEHKEPERG